MTDTFTITFVTADEQIHTITGTPAAHDPHVVTLTTGDRQVIPDTAVVVQMTRNTEQ
jgi:hypothetical protein